jgi:transcriptional regulator with XRE-family HTH domain
MTRFKIKFGSLYDTSPSALRRNPMPMRVSDGGGRDAFTVLGVTNAARLPTSTSVSPSMSFPEHLAVQRKTLGLSQRALAERVGVHLTQVQRYESGAGQPTLDVIRRIAVALSVSSDFLIFDEGERGPQDDGLKLIFEAVDQFTAEEKAVAKEVLEGLIIKYQSRRWDLGRAAAKPVESTG